MARAKYGGLDLKFQSTPKPDFIIEPPNKKQKRSAPAQVVLCFNTKKLGSPLSVVSGSRFCHLRRRRKMKRHRDPNEIRAKVYSMKPELLQDFKEEILSNYTRSSVSRVRRPDQEGTFWCFINIYMEA